ncbi:hypothetical protein D3C72_1435670 [compost metagenome]
MMRPVRAFIIGRSTARDRRNTAVRFVSMTLVQSSSFMRMANWSWVMPALFTSTARPPWAFTISSITASQRAASFTFSTTPWPCRPSAFRYSPMAAAPDSLVAVPITVAP